MRVAVQAGVVRLTGTAAPADSEAKAIGEHEGRVMRLTTRDTTLMTLEGVGVRLPNSTVLKKRSGWCKVRSEAVRYLKGAFEQGGIELPPPSFKIETSGATELRTEQRQDPRLPAEAAPTEDLTQQAHEVAQDAHLQRQMAREPERAGEEDFLCDDGTAPGDQPEAKAARPR